MTDSRNPINRFFKYLFSKRSEIYDLDYRDALLAQANVRIYRKRTHKTREMVPLKHLKFIHSLERENARNVLEDRKKALEKNKDHVLVDGMITLSALYKYIPSISPIKAVKANRINYFLFEGNGRIAAVKEVFGDDMVVVRPLPYSIL